MQIFFTHNMGKLSTGQTGLIRSLISQDLALVDSKDVVSALHGLLTFGSIKFICRTAEHPYTGLARPDLWKSPDTYWIKGPT